MKKVISSKETHTRDVIYLSSITYILPFSLSLICCKSLFSEFLRKRWYLVSCSVGKEVHLWWNLLFILPGLHKHFIFYFYFRNSRVLRLRWNRNYRVKSISGEVLLKRYWMGTFWLNPGRSHEDDLKHWTSSVLWWYEVTS